VPVLITETAFTGPADPDSARDIAVTAFMTPRLPPPPGCVSDLGRAPGN
jgi:hypothetical protein